MSGAKVVNIGLKMGYDKIKQATTAEDNSLEEEVDWNNVSVSGPTDFQVISFSNCKFSQCA
jgi:hypothetical protein